MMATTRSYLVSTNCSDLSTILASSKHYRFARRIYAPHQMQVMTRRPAFASERYCLPSRICTSYDCCVPAREKCHLPSQVIKRRLSRNTTVWLEHDCDWIFPSMPPKYVSLIDTWYHRGVAYALQPVFNQHAGPLASYAPSTNVARDLQLPCVTSFWQLSVRDLVISMSCGCGICS